MTRRKLAAFSCSLILLLSCGLDGCTASARPGPIVVKDYAPLGGAVNEEVFGPALQTWVRHCNALVRQFESLPPEQADSLLIERSALYALQDSEPLKRLEQSVRPVLLRWSENWDESALSDADRRVFVLLRQSGLQITEDEGWPFLLVDQPFFNKLIKPFLGASAPDYLAVKDSQPPYLVSDAALIYGIEEMGAWAVAWEDYLAAHPSGLYARDAARRYSTLMEFMLLSDFPNTPAFPTHNGGRMEQSWIAELQKVASARPDTRTAAIVRDFLTAIKADGWTLSPAVKAAVAARIRPPE